MKTRWTLMTVIVAVVAGPAWAQQARGPGQSSAADLARTLRSRQTWRGPRQQSPLQEWLGQRVPTVSFDETLFEDVIRWMRELPGEMNIVVEWNVMEGLGVDREAPVTLELKNVPLGTILGLVLKQAGADVPLGYRGTDNILTITLEEELNQPGNYVIRTYQVADLARIHVNFDNSPSIRLSSLQQQQSGGGSSGSNLFSDDDDDDDENDLDERVQTIIDSIVETIEPESWSQNQGQGTITAINDVIIVNNTLSVHEKLGGAVRVNSAGR